MGVRSSLLGWAARRPRLLMRHSYHFRTVKTARPATLHDTRVIVIAYKPMSSKWCETHTTSLLRKCPLVISSIAVKFNISVHFVFSFHYQFDNIFALSFCFTVHKLLRHFSQFGKQHRNLYLIKCGIPVRIYESKTVCLLSVRMCSYDFNDQSPFIGDSA
jgi:hypothetical protein